MISHVVLMKPRPDLTSAERQALVAAFGRAIREISTVRDVRVGKRVTHGAGYEAGVPDAADYIAVIDFDDLEGLQTYLRHPAHEELSARFYESLSSALVYDFEAGGMEVLEKLALEKPV
jgi:Stress responsive A/B Barrel Domain